MAVTPQQVLDILTRLAPPALAESWDNVGLLVDSGRPTDAIMTTLEITPTVIEEAAAAGCGILVAHHPVIFSPLKTITAEDLPALLLKHGISAICMHTNLDAADGGVNDTLADLLGMQDTAPFADGCGRIGRIAPTTVPQLAAICTEKLGAHCKVVDPGMPITCLAEVSGAGGSFWEEARRLGAQCLVTGEASHHVACDAKRLGLGLVVAGHWATERPIAPVLAHRLQAELPNVQVRVSAQDADPFTYL